MLPYLQSRVCRKKIFYGPRRAVYLHRKKGNIISEKKTYTNDAITVDNLRTELLSCTGCSEKIVFFHCNPSLAYIAVRDLQSSQRNASVQSLLLAGNCVYNQ